MSLSAVLVVVDELDVALVSLVPELKNIPGLPEPVLDEIETIATEVHKDINALKSDINEVDVAPTVSHIVALVEKMFKLIPVGLLPPPASFIVAAVQGLLPVILAVFGVPA